MVLEQYISKCLLLSTECNSPKAPDYQSLLFISAQSPFLYSLFVPETLKLNLVMVPSCGGDG